MEKLFEFLGDNYWIFLLIAGVLFLILIGFIVDGKRKGKASTNAPAANTTPVNNVDNATVQENLVAPSEPSAPTMPVNNVTAPAQNTVPEVESVPTAIENVTTPVIDNSNPAVVENVTMPTIDNTNPTVVENVSPVTSVPQEPSTVTNVNDVVMPSTPVSNNDTIVGTVPTAPSVVSEPQPVNVPNQAYNPDNTFIIEPVVEETPIQTINPVSSTVQTFGVPTEPQPVQQPTIQTQQPNENSTMQNVNNNIQ